MKEGMKITDLQVCLLLAMQMNPHERGYLHNYVHIYVKDQYFFSLSLGSLSIVHNQSTPHWGGGDFKV